MERIKLAIALTVVCVLVLILVYLFAERLFTQMKENMRSRVGEGVINRLLSTLNPRKYVLMRGIVLPSIHGSVKIDHVVVSTYGIFIVEAIDWGGKVRGTQNDDEWTHFDSAGNVNKQFNPMIINEMHVSTLQNLLGLGYDDFISIVAFISAVKLDVTIDAKIANINNLISVVKSHHHKRFTRKQMLFLANEIRVFNLAVS